MCQQHCEWAQSAHTEAAAARAESDGPELTGVGELFNFDTLTGYVGYFDENLKNEIEAREEASLTSRLSSSLSIHTPGGDFADRLVDGIQVDYAEPDLVVYASTNVV